MPKDALPITSDEPSGARSRRWRLIAAWCAYDWGSSAPPALILAFVFATYFTQAVAPSETIGTVMWGNMLSASGVAIALLSLLLGPVADMGAGRKTWLGLFTAVAVVPGCLLWLVTPTPDMVWMALILCFLVNVGLEVSMVFYNAMLPAIAPPHMVGRVSGWGWGIGYIGAIVCLALALMLVQAEPPPFGLNAEDLEPVRATSPLASLWMLAFAMPLFLLVPEHRAGVRLREAIVRGLSQVRSTLALLRGHREAARFLIGHILYRDGVNTMFAFGGVYAAGTFGMDTQEVLVFGVALYVTAGIGAFSFAWLDDRIGGRRTVLLSLAGLISLGVPMLLVTDSRTFFALGMAFAVFFGPVQAASRSLMARLTPPGLEGQMFGLFALSGKVISPLGPLLVGWLTFAAGSQRAGLAVVPVFLLIGGIILWGVREPGRGR